MSTLIQTAGVHERRVPQPGGRCHGGWQCLSPISSFDTPKRLCFGLLKPRPMRRSAFCSRWRTHGPKRRSQARQLAAAPRQSAGHRRAVAGGGLVARSSHRSSLPVFTDDLESLPQWQTAPCAAPKMTRVALRLPDRTDLTNEIIARRIIELAKVGSAIRTVCAWRAAEFSGAAGIRRRPPVPVVAGKRLTRYVSSPRAVRMGDPP